MKDEDVKFYKDKKRVCLGCKERFDNRLLKAVHHSNNPKCKLIEDEKVAKIGEIFFRNWDKKTPEQKKALIGDTIKQFRETKVDE